MCCLSQHLEHLRLDAEDIAEEDIAVEVGIVAEGIASVADIVAASVLPFQPSSNQHC